MHFSIVIRVVVWSIWMDLVFLLLLMAQASSWNQNFFFSLIKFSSTIYFMSAVNYFFYLYFSMLKSESFNLLFFNFCCDTKHKIIFNSTLNMYTCSFTNILFESSILTRDILRNTLFFFRHIINFYLFILHF